MEYLAQFQDSENDLKRKSRQMFLSWLGSIAMLWSVMHRDGFAGCVGSESADLIDDGGVNATTDSFFGRMLYVYEHLPEWMREWTTVDFTKRRIRCPSRKSYVVGDARKGRIGRGGTYDVVLIDEFAYVEYSESSHASAEPAAKKLIYQSTPNGRQNCFARFWFDPNCNFRKTDCLWWRHPGRAAGAYRDEDGKLRSPFYDRATQNMTEERRGREWDGDFTTSLVGRVYKEFMYAAPPAGHVVPASRLPYNPNLPLSICIDFGHARKTAGLFLQFIGPKILVVGEFTGRHRGARLNARDLAKTVRALGYTGSLAKIEFVPDPAAQYEDHGSGQALLWYYEQAGFSNWLFPMLKGPGSVELGIALVRDKLAAMEVLVSDACTGFIDDIQAYRYPVDPRTDEIRGNKPAHDMASHRMDAFRYGATAYYTAAGPNAEDTFSHLTAVADIDPESGRIRSVIDDDDDSAPVGPGRGIRGVVRGEIPDRFYGEGGS